MIAIRESIRRERGDKKISTAKIKKEIQQLMSKDFSEQFSYNKENMKLKVTYEVECNYESGKVVYGNLVDVIDVQQKSNIEDQVFPKLYL